MVVDSSAFLSILLYESDRVEMLRKLDLDRYRFASTVTLTESANVILTRLGSSGVNDLDRLIVSLDIKVVPVDLEQAVLARDALRRYGKGRHKARLNLGDSFPYALSQQMKEPLLFKGNDFIWTDVLKA
jgi:ribonuclease VapC